MSNHRCSDPDYEWGGRTGSARRLVATILRLQSRWYSIPELARLHDVSTKTIRRDLRALEDSGVPIESQIATTEARDDLLHRNEYRIRSDWYPTRHWLRGELD